ncbi:hypothetical protein [Amycolatopsis sp.]|nr:hypothetical protein [Amycolatopsis sp.]HVV14176.1 hypothetical protein [Amycolatopsis sp.]
MYELIEAKRDRVALPRAVGTYVDRRAGLERILDRPVDLDNVFAW